MSNNSTSTRLTAWVVTLCMIVLATLLGGKSSLERERSKAESVFFAGSAGQGINQDLERMADDSFNLTTVAARYLGNDHAQVLQVQGAVQLLRDSDEPPEKHQAADHLLYAVQQLSETMKEQDMSGSDLDYHNKLVVDIQSAHLLAENGDYNQAAASFNGILRQFPANILSQVTGVTPLEYYE